MRGDLRDVNRAALRLKIRLLLPFAQGKGLNGGSHAE
jgi:hypothetical protein